MQPHNNKESNPHDQERLLCRETEGNSLAQDINPSNIFHQRNSNYRSNTIMNQTILCSTFEEFGQMIFELVSRGLTFDADATCLTIELTGGF